MQIYKQFITLSFFISPFISYGAEPIIPSMINIPAGDFFMGSENGDAVAKPMHSVTLPAFRMGEYQVTVAEFKQFVKDTGYQAATNCNDLIGESWLASPAYKEGTASWDDHRYSYSDYQPAVCLSSTDVDAYIDWLSETTGTQYRLPTEQEWEYATKGNTTSQYFWGEDPNLTQACSYGNFADQYDEYVSSSNYGASYVGFLGHANCDDGEAFTAIVGLYRPNPFGLYDMIGNASHYLSTCYYAGYDEVEGQDLDPKTCKVMAHRGSSWHNKPFPHESRGVDFQFDWTPSTLKGFRLAADGHANTVEESTTLFKNQLAMVQKERLASRLKLPQAPKNTFLSKLKFDGDKTHKLHWQPSETDKVTGYDIYQSNTPYAHLMGKHYKNFYTKIHHVNSSDNTYQVSVPSEGASYRVVATTPYLSSLPSKAAVVESIKVQKIPGRIEMQNTQALENVLLSYRAEKKDKPELYYLSKPTPGWQQPLVTASFKIDVNETGWYTLNYNGFSRKTGEFFSVWQDNTLAGKVSFDAGIKDTDSNRHKVFLQEGKSNLQITVKKSERDFWMLGWIEIIQE